MLFDDAHKGFSTKDHWKFFHEFCLYETKAGGPDPHLKLVAELSKNESFEEKVWRGGCYIAVYNAPFAEAIWREWSWERIQKEPKLLSKWMEKNFKKLVTRRERKTVRRPEWMTEYLTGYAAFARVVLPCLVEDSRDAGPAANYEQLWEASQEEIPRFGRYVALKLLEYYRVMGITDARLPDLRPEGGWSPRVTLGDLWPRQKRVADENEAPEFLALANKLASETQKKLKGDYGLELDMFELQVLLCDYKQSWKGRRQYPGRSIDTEMKYTYESDRLWNLKSGIWEARKILFPVEHLGEVQGWSGPREKCANCLADYRYTWSDTLYDFKKTWNFVQPVRRS